MEVDANIGKCSFSVKVKRGPVLNGQSAGLLHTRRWGERQESLGDQCHKAPDDVGRQMVFNGAVKEDGKAGLKLLVSFPKQVRKKSHGNLSQSREQY
jgi:hypothetical protein